MNEQPVSFPNWKEVLAATPSVVPQLKAAYLREILNFLKHCKVSRSAATVGLAKEYLAWREQQSSGPAREALRWFYRQGMAGRSSQATPQDSRPQSPPEPAAPVAALSPARSLPMRRPAIRTSQPPPAGSDLGSVPWERDLIRTIRERN